MDRIALRRQDYGIGPIHSPYPKKNTHPAAGGDPVHPVIFLVVPVTPLIQNYSNFLSLLLRKVN